MNDYKWYPYFQLSSALRFSDTDYYFGFTDTLIGSRLCFKNKHIAEYAGKTFIEQYEKIMKF
jgi:hypothetical protein